MNHPLTLCPECHAISYIQDEDCWRCGVTLTPGCPECKHPILIEEMHRGMCMWCGSSIKHYALVRPWTTTSP